MMNIMQLETQMGFLIWILLAGVCGGVIGYERKSCSKEAGTRTHLIMASGAALIMIVSKYEFSNALGDRGVALDPSRITVRIVTGVGFLGADMILIRKNTISGLTTAAGTWATSVIGIMVGSGLYALEILIAVPIIFVQIILHRNHRWLWGSYKEELSFVVDQNKEALQDLRERLGRMQIEILDVNLTQEYNCHQADLIAVLSDTYQAVKLLGTFHDVAYIHGVDAQGIVKP